MAEVTKPSSPGWASVVPRYNKVRPRHRSPFTLASTSYTWPGENWSFVFTLPPIKDPTKAAAWITFLYDLAKAENYFVCNVAPYTPSAVGEAGEGGVRTLNLRLVNPEASWDVGRAKVFGITFECEIDQ